MNVELLLSYALVAVIGYLMGAATAEYRLLLELRRWRRFLSTKNSDAIVIKLLEKEEA